MAASTSNVTQTLTDIVGYIAKAKSATSGFNLADVAKIARVEPIVLVSSNLTTLKELPDILQGVLNIYSGYYLQAVQLLSSAAINVKILKILDRLNPDRDIKTVVSANLGLENYSLKSDINYTSVNYDTLTLESFVPKFIQKKVTKSHQTSIDNIAVESADSVESARIGKIDNFDKLNYSVGKILNVEFNVKDANGNATSVQIPVVVKLDTMVFPSEVMNSVLTVNKQELSFGSRLKDAIAGRISFIKDFILVSDLIKEHKKALIKDPTGYYAKVLARTNNSKFFSLLPGNMSLNSISSVFVISEKEESEIAKKIGGKLTNDTTRNIVFDNTLAMMIVVVDREWERVSIYIRGQNSGFTQASFTDFKSASDKNSSAQILEFMKAFNMGSPISF
jgi:hypothetical protein